MAQLTLITNDQERLYDLKHAEEEKREETRRTVNRVNFLEELNTRGMNTTSHQRSSLYEAGREIHEHKQIENDFKKVDVCLIQFDGVSKLPGFEELAKHFEARVAEQRKLHPLFYSQNFKGLSHVESDKDQTPDAIHREGSGTDAKLTNPKNEIADLKANVYFTANSLYAAEDAIMHYEMLNHGKLPDLLKGVLDDIRKSISDLHRAGSTLKLIENRSHPHDAVSEKAA